MYTMSIMAVMDKKAKKARRTFAKTDLDATAGLEDFQGLFAVPATDLRKDAHAIFGRVEHGGEEIILTRHGKPAVALVSLAVLKAIRSFEDSQDVEAAAAARHDIAKHGTVPWAEVKRRNAL